MYLTVFLILNHGYRNFSHTPLPALIEHVFFSSLLYLFISIECLLNRLYHEFLIGYQRNPPPPSHTLFITSHNSFIYLFIHSFFILPYIQNFTTQEGNNMRLKKK